MRRRLFRPLDRQKRCHLRVLRHGRNERRVDQRHAAEAPLQIATNEQIGHRAAVGRRHIFRLDVIAAEYGRASVRIAIHGLLADGQHDALVAYQLVGDLKDGGVIMAGQSAVARDHHDARPVVRRFVEERRFHVAMRGDVAHNLTNRRHIRPRVLHALAGASQLRAGHQLHGGSNLLRAFDAAYAELDVLH